MSIKEGEISTFNMVEYHQEFKYGNLEFRISKSKKNIGSLIDLHQQINIYKESMQEIEGNLLNQVFHYI